jgi:hypothetical protein
MFLFLSGAQLFRGKQVAEVSAYPKKLLPIGTAISNAPQILRMRPFRINQISPGNR